MCPAPVITPANGAAIAAGPIAAIVPATAATALLAKAAIGSYTCTTLCQRDALIRHSPAALRLVIPIRTRRYPSTWELAARISGTGDAVVLVTELGFRGAPPRNCRSRRALGAILSLL